ncbi:hypothetical protein [Lutibacter sp.]|uniref:hypothetical protein n=1 Tax=Lutibacter sp. TaxID=1925666 RepID=UPI0025C2EA49|nr:hypothetical protein [Lutibacter sp.]MCF6168007.1 hypothetical protein [Lutibacter sp.]
MKDNNQEFMDEVELMYTPLTKQLLINYVITEYQEEADTSDESLKRELNWLYKNNQLSNLIISELIHSEGFLKQASGYSASYKQ